MRPGTLAEVAALAAQGDSFDRCLANFLDGFYAAPNTAALAAAPALLAHPVLFEKRGGIHEAELRHVQPQ
jgi:hypothetical protein